MTGPFPLSGSPELASRINAFDWSSTQLGPLDQWPSSLRIALNLVLGSRFPMQLLWGSDYHHFYNDAYIPIAADKHPEALGRPGATIWPEIWQQVLPVLEQVRASGEPSWADDQLLVLHRRGWLEEGYYTFSYGPVRDDDEAVNGIFVAVTETTRRVLSERRLRIIRDLGVAIGDLADEESLLRSVATILAQNPADLPFALLYLLDPDRQTLRLGCTVGLAPSHPAAQPLIAQAEQPAAGWPFAEVLKGSAPVSVDQLAFAAPLPGGAWEVPATAALMLPLHSDPHTPLIGCLIAGLSPRLQLDAEYHAFLERVAAQLSSALAGTRAYARANEAVRLRDDFLSIAAHELKTPLTPLIGRLQLLQRRLAQEGLAQRYLDDMASLASEAKRLVSMIDSLLDISRLRSDQLSIDHTPLDLRQIVAQVSAEIQPTLTLHQVELSQPAAPVVVAGDALRLEQVVRNLVSNAVKYSPRGGTVTLEIRKQTAAATLTVRDQGIGIAPEVLPRIFERYYRENNPANATVGGLGIGLFVVHEIVRLHGGSISVESTPNVGSSFSVTLPALT